MDKNIRVFISSTFKNMDEERNQLKLCFQSTQESVIGEGINLKEIDFRWGLPTGAHVMKTCLKAIDYSKPYFICILGSDYGTEPKIDEYEAEKNIFEEYNSFIKDKVINKLSYTAMEIHYAIEHNRIDPDHSCFLLLEYQEKQESKQAHLIQYIRNNGYEIINCSTIDEFKKEVARFLEHLVNAHVQIKESVIPHSKEIKYPFVGFKGANTQSNQLELYRNRNKQIINSIIQDTVERNFEQRLTDFVLSNKKVCHVDGDMGVGKSTILARWLSNIENDNQHKNTYIYHYVEGYTDDIYEHFYLEIANLCEKSIYDYMINVMPRVDNFNSFAIFGESIMQLDDRDKIVFVIDGDASLINVNGIVDFINSIEKNVKLIISTRNILVQSENVERIKIGPLESDDVYRLTVNYLTKHYKSDKEASIVANILKKSSILNAPETLLSVLNDLRCFANYSNIYQLSEFYSNCDSIYQLYDKIISHWECHVPKLEDSDILAWLAYSQCGLAENDIINILDIADRDIYLWHQFFCFLKPFFGWDGDRIVLKNIYLKEAIKQRYRLREKEIKSSMIRYFEKDNIPLEKQYDELPLLYKELDHRALLEYIQNPAVFDYAYSKTDKKERLVDYWSLFSLCDYEKYLTNNYTDIKERILQLVDMGDFLSFNKKLLFDDEFEINECNKKFCDQILRLLSHKNNSQLFDPIEKAKLYRKVVSGYIDVFKYDEASKIIGDIVTEIKPVIEERWKFYETSIWVKNRPEFQESKEKEFTSSYVVSLARTQLLNLLGEFISLTAEKYYCSFKITDFYEALFWIEKEEQFFKNELIAQHVDNGMQFLGMINTILKKSALYHTHGFYLYCKKQYGEAYDALDTAFMLRWECLKTKEKYGKKDQNQESNIMETYKLINYIQPFNTDLFLQHHEYYIEAIEKHGYCLPPRFLIPIKHNLAAFCYNYAMENMEIMPTEQITKFLGNAKHLYSEVTELSVIDDCYMDYRIKSSFFFMKCTACLSEGEDIIKMCTDIILLYESSDDISIRCNPEIEQIIVICKDCIANSLENK